MQIKIWILVLVLVAAIVIGYMIGKNAKKTLVVGAASDSSPVATDATSSAGMAQPNGKPPLKKI